MQIQGADYVNSSSSVYAYSPSYANCASESAGISTQDNTSISAFSGESDSGAAQDAGALQSQKAQAESELSSIKGKADEVHAQISTRKDEVNKEQNGDQACSDQQAEYDAAKAEYDQASAAKSEAQQRSSQINQENSANEQTISANSQQKQQVSSNIASVQSQLASLTPPSAPGGEDSEGQAAYQAQLAAYNAQKSALQSQLAALQQQLQQLEAQGQQLQAKKAQLAGEQQQVQAQSAQQDAAMQSAQAKMDAAQQAMGANDPELQQAWEDDAELQSLQNEYDQLQQEQAQLEAEISQLDAQIAETEVNEAKDVELQAARADEADQALQTAAEQAGCDIAGAEAKAQDAAAQEKFGKGYAELSEDEQLEIAAEVDGAVTLELMDSARRMLKEDPDNAEAQEVLEKGQASLEAQENLAYAELSSSIDNLPASLQDGAAASMDAARTMAKFTGGDPEKAATEALAKYASQHAGNAEMSAEDKSSLQEVVGASGNYLNSIEKNDQGRQLVQSVEAGAKVKEAIGALKDGPGSIDGGIGSMLGDGTDNVKEIIKCNVGDTIDYVKHWLTDKFGTDADKLQQAMDDVGIDDKHVVRINGTKGDDTIDVTIDSDGSYTVSVNGEESVYSAEEARRLMIDGGKGNDRITIHGNGKDNGETPQSAVFVNGGKGDDVIGADSEVNTQLFITGGDGNDELRGGNADDIIIDSSGSTTVEGGLGSDIIKTGKGKDVITDAGGSNRIYSGDGDDTVTLNGFGSSSVDGGKGADTITAVHGNNALFGGLGNDIITGGDGNDFIFGDNGHDTIHAGDGDDVIYGGYGEDNIKGGDGDDVINAGYGNDTVYGGEGSDTIFGLDGNDRLYGEGGADTIATGHGSDTVDGGDGADTIRHTNNFLTYGKDKVINPDKEDDIKVLNPIGVDVGPEDDYQTSHSLFNDDDDKPFQSSKEKIPHDFEIGTKYHWSETGSDGKTHNYSRTMDSDEQRVFDTIIEDSLKAFAATEPGQELLKDVKRASGTVTFEATGDPDSYHDTAWWSSDSTVKLNPGFSYESLYQEHNPMLIMAREMSHAYNIASGIAD